MTVIGLLALALSATAVATDINTLGPKAAVGRLVAGDDWNRALEAIAAGGRDWISLAPQLARGVDTVQGDDLALALAQALPLAAGEVLAVVDLQRGPVLGVQRICGLPFLRDTVPDLPGYIASARAAVTAVPPLALAKARTQCLQQLDNAAGRQLATPVAGTTM